MNSIDDTLNANINLNLNKFEELIATLTIEVQNIQVIIQDKI